MPDAAPFLAAIRAAPDDDAPRLIYADWLDEHGQPERAEFIRVQCELARRESPELRKRESELLAGRRDELAEPLTAPGLQFRFWRGFVVAFGHAGVFRLPNRGYDSLLRFYPDGTVLLGNLGGRLWDEFVVSFHRGSVYAREATYALSPWEGGCDLSIATGDSLSAMSGRLHGDWLELESMAGRLFKLGDENDDCEPDRYELISVPGMDSSQESPQDAVPFCRHKTIGC